MYYVQIDDIACSFDALEPARRYARKLTRRYNVSACLVFTEGGKEKGRAEYAFGRQISKKGAMYGAPKISITPNQYVIAEVA